MKRRVIKKQMRRILNSEFPVMFKLSAMHELIKASQKSSCFQFSDLPYVRFERFSTTLHKGVITVSEDDKMVGLCDILYSMCDHYDDEIRLLFAMM